LRSQLDIYGSGFLNGQPNADVIFSGSSSSNGQLNASSNQPSNANFVKLEENELDANEVFIKTHNKEKTKRSFSPNKIKTTTKNGLKSNHANFEDENDNERSDDDDVDLTNPEMTFISGGENNENINENNITKFPQFNPLINVNNNSNNNLKLNKKTKPDSDGDEAELDTVNNLYNKLLIHNTDANKNFKLDGNVSNGLVNEDNVSLF